MTAHAGNRCRYSCGCGSEVYQSGCSYAYHDENRYYYCNEHYSGNDPPGSCVIGKEKRAWEKYCSTEYKNTDFTKMSDKDQTIIEKEKKAYESKIKNIEQKYTQNLKCIDEEYQKAVDILRKNSETGKQHLKDMYERELKNEKHYLQRKKRRIILGNKLGVAPENIRYQ